MSGTAEASASEEHRYYVHDRGAGRHAGHVVRASDPFDAAIVFAEHWGDADAGDLSVNVRDCETGEEQCVVVHLGQGEAEPC